MNTRTELDAFGSDPEVAHLRIPPHSIEAETSVLGALLMDNRVFDLVADSLSEDDFYRHEHRLMFGAIKAAIDAGQPADPITLYERLEADGKAADVGGLQALEALGMCVPSARHIRRYAEIVRERAIRRKLIATSDEIEESFGDKLAQAARIAQRNRTEFYKLLERHALEPKAFKS